jgi:tripartite ATP-independent transporter DctM subunit
MILGTLAGAGTLGLLIPPSIILIVYGASAEVSIARLFIAGILPGLLLIVLFMGFTALWALWTKEQGRPEPELAWKEKLQRTARLLPVVLLIAAVIGTIYAGLATPSEAAAFGVLGSLILSALSRSLSWRTFIDGLLAATRTSCMIAFILAGAAFLTVAMGYTGVPRALAGLIADMQLSPLLLLLALTVFFVIMGCFLDGISVVVLTTSIILPMVEAAQLDLIWFGIYLVLVVEMSQITPPVGFNLFVLQGLTGRDIFQIAWAALPFFGVLLLGLALICLFPEIVTYLPEQMSRR